MKDLTSLATPAGHFTISAFDHRNSLFELLNPQDPSSVSADEVVALKRLFIAAFAGLSSAILIDPVYGLDYGLDLEKEVPPDTGILMSLEESSYDESQAGRVTKLLPHWGVADIKARAAAAKLLLYYHPDAPIATKQLALVDHLSHQCRQNGVIFLIEPIIYGVGEYSHKDKAAITLKVIDQLSPLVDILKLEFPLDVMRSTAHDWQAVSRDLTRHATVPWILLSRGMAFDKFHELTRITSDTGASGIAVGRAVWQEIADISIKYPDPAEKLIHIKTFLFDTGRARLQSLTDIVAAHARPWTAFQT